MISTFGNLRSLNDGTTKSVSVTAFEDATGGQETITFNINGTVIPIQHNFGPNGIDNVSVNHSISSGGNKVLVKVSSSGTPPLTQMLNLDKQPGDNGTGG